MRSDSIDAAAKVQSRITSEEQKRSLRDSLRQMESEAVSDDPLEFVYYDETENDDDVMYDYNSGVSRVPLKNKKRKDKLLNLNVSGTIFEVWASTLENFPDTLLGNPEIREYFYDPDEKWYFFDRDPEIFRHIMNYYRSGRLHYPKTDCVGSVDDELAYFGISTDLITDCCYEAESA